MRQTDRNRRNQAARRQAEALIQAATYKELRWLWRRLYPFLQRYNRERPHKRMNKRQLLRMKKQDFQDVDQVWTEFKRRLAAALHNSFRDSAELLAAVDRAFWQPREVMISPDDIVTAYRDQIGRLITRVADDTRAWTGNQIAQWYQTPGSTFQQLITTLAPQYSIRRAALIGTNEITGLDSVIQRGVMEQVGSNRWYWQTMRDEVVCTREIEGPDGAIYAGCADLQGREFGQDEVTMMPPDGSHIGCRCSAIIKVDAEAPIPIPSWPQAQPVAGYAPPVVLPSGEAELLPTPEAAQAMGLPTWLIEQAEDVYQQQLDEEDLGDIEM